jgi:hypothetical protein
MHANEGNDMIVLVLRMHVSIAIFDGHLDEVLRNVQEPM